MLKHYVLVNLHVRFIHWDYNKNTKRYNSGRFMSTSSETLHESAFVKWSDACYFVTKAADIFLICCNNLTISALFLNL